MAGLRIAVPVWRASVKQTTNITVFTNTVRIPLDATQSLVQGRMIPPVLILLDAKAIFEDFRNVPLANLVPKAHSEDLDDPDTDPVPGPNVGPPLKYIPGWTGRWFMDGWHHYAKAADSGILGNSPFAGLTPETARDSEHYKLRSTANEPIVPLVTTPPSSGRMLRMAGNSASDNAFRVISLDSVDYNEPNVDLRVKFRMWEPMDFGSLVRPWRPVYNDSGEILEQGIYPGHFAQSSNQCMLILSIDGGFAEDNNENEIYGYALRNNWDEGPWPTSWGIPGFAWELVRFHGIQDLIEGQTAVELRTRVWEERSIPLPGVTLGRRKVKLQKWKSRSRITPRNKKQFLEGDPDQRAITLGEGSVVMVTSGWGDLYRPLLIKDNDGNLHPAFPNLYGGNPAGKGTMTWSEIPGAVEKGSEDAQGQWIWARMMKTLEGEKVRIRGKVWFDGYDEPTGWPLNILDSSPEANQGGYTGVGSVTPIHAEPGQMGQGRQVGPSDIDQVIVQIPEVLPGTNVSFTAKVIEGVIVQFTPDFINTGTLTSTWWDEYTVGTTPGDFFILRPGPGPAPDANAVSNPNVRGKPMPPDRLENFLLKTDPALDPTKFPGDRGTVSLEHATRDLTEWLVYDPLEPYARGVNPDMPRDALAWDEPYPGDPTYQGHDGQIDDAEILVKFQADSWDQAMSFWLRASGTKGHEYGYALTCITGGQSPVTENETADTDIELGSIGWAVYKYVNGERITVGRINFPWRASVWWWGRIVIQGSSERQADRILAPIGHEGDTDGQPHAQFPYGGVVISMKFWMDGTDEAVAPWGHPVIDDGHNLNIEEEMGFSGYRRNWDEYDEFNQNPFGRYRPLVPPIDRGWFAVGGPSIGNTQRYAEIHVLGSRTPILDSSAYDDIHNLLSREAAAGAQGLWAGENVTIGTVVHEPFEGGTALELTGTLASAGGAPVRVVSTEHVDVTPGQAYVALATLDNFQHQWTASALNTYLDRYRLCRAGLRWYDADGNVLPNTVRQHDDLAYEVASTDSMRSGWSSARTPGEPLYVGEGYYPPEFGFTPIGGPEFTSKSWYDLRRTDGPGDPYEGFAFPTDKPQPFRWQEKWRWMIHAGALSSRIRESYFWDENLDGYGTIEHPEQITGNIGWAVPMLHVAPPGAVTATVVIELRNTQAVPAGGVVRVPYIGGTPGSLPTAPPRLRDERYRVGEIAVFPAMREPTYASWNMAPGQFALPPVDAPDNHLTFMAFDSEVHSHVSIEVDAPMTASLVMFKGTTHVTRPQFSRPMQDAHDGGWTNQIGSQELIWQTLDEADPNDLDYAQSSQMPEDDLYVALLTRMRNPDPDSDEKYRLHIRFRRRGIPETLRFSLYMGEVPIADFEESPDKTFATVVCELTPEQVAAINDYADLRVRLVGDVVSV